MLRGEATEWLARLSLDELDRLGISASSEDRRIARREMMRRLRGAAPLFAEISARTTRADLNSPADQGLALVVGKPTEKGPTDAG